MSIVNKAINDKNYIEVKNTIIEVFAERLNMSKQELEKIFEVQETLMKQDHANKATENTGDLIIKEGDKIIKG